MVNLKKNLFRSLQFILFLAIGIILLYYAFKGVPLADFWKELIRARYEWVIMGVIIGVVAHFVRALRWKLLLEPLGYQPKLLNSFHAVMTGYLANYAFPRIGEVTRCGVLNKTDRIPVDKLLGTVLIERTIDLLMLVILLFVVFAAKVQFFGSFINEKIFGPAYSNMTDTFNSAPVLWIIFALIILSAFLAGYIFRQRIGRIRGMHRVKEALRGIIAGFRSAFMLKRKWSFIVYTILIWFLYFLMTWVVFFAVPATSALSPIDGLFILVFGSIGMALPVQGGFGTYHLLVALGLSLFDISRADGMVYAIISHESQTLMILLVGGISMFIVFFGKKSKNG